MIGDIIFFSLENWDEIWRRNQFLCDGLIRRHPDTRILFVAPAKDVSNAVRTGKWSEINTSSVRAITPDKRIICMRPWKLLPNTLDWCRLLNERFLRTQVRAEANRLGFRSPLLWINDHSAVHTIQSFKSSDVIYDVTDDWTTLTQSPKVTALIQLQDRELCNKADAVIVCSERLQQMKASMTRNLHVIPNGVDANHYLRVSDSSLPLPKEALEWQKPVLGYTGSIHGDRVDILLIADLAQKMSRGTIVLIGPVMLSPEERQRLEKFKNIIFTGPKSYADIPDYMRAFDICMTPHLVTQFTESLNPIKLWEYLAAGKPIISTRVAGFRDYPEFVLLVETAEQFMSAVNQALKESPELASRRRSEAARHSWNSRLDAVEAVVSQIRSRK